MEHLLPKNSKVPIIVPCFCTQEIFHPLRDFDTYPERNGWDFSVWRKHDAILQGIDLPKWLKSQGKTMQDFIFLWQTWLWFTLLASALQKPIESKDFTRLVDEGKVVLTTAKLEEVLENYEEKVVATKDLAPHKKFAYRNFALQLLILRSKFSNISIPP